MGTSKLTEKAIEALLGELKSTEIVPNSKAYDATPEIKQEYVEDLGDAEKIQELGHKDRLMKVVSFLAIGSFIFLAVVVIAQMTIRFYKPAYTGVSDDVVKIIAISVFGQVIVVVGSLAGYLFKKGKK